MYSKVPTTIPEPGEQRLFGQPLVNGLGDAEVDHFGRRLAVSKRDEHVCRLDVAVNDSLLVSVLNRLADKHEELEPLSERQTIAIAVFGDRRCRRPVP